MSVLAALGAAQRAAPLLVALMPDLLCRGDHVLKRIPHLLPHQSSFPLILSPQRLVAALPRPPQFDLRWNLEAF
jgi:hypothetical protein